MLIKSMEFLHSHNKTDSAVFTHISLTSSLWDIGIHCRPKVSDQGLHCLLIECSNKIWDFSKQQQQNTPNFGNGLWLKWVRF